MSDPTTALIAAAARLLAGVNPDNLRRHPKRMSVDPAALRRLADAIERACPGIVERARTAATCGDCDKAPWVARHADACPQRDHVVYDADDRPQMPPARAAR